MKGIFKVSLLILMLLLCGSARAQYTQGEISRITAGVGFTYANNAMASGTNASPWQSPTYMPGVGLEYLHRMTDNTRYRINGDMICGMVGDDVVVHTLLSTGVELGTPNYPYCVVMMRPRIEIHGHGHQVYGDYPYLLLSMSIGAGYRHPIPYGNLILEAGIMGDVLTLATDNYKRDEIGLFITFGYQYIIR